MRKMRDASASSYLKDQRLAACAVSQEPAWLWNTDGSQVLWANAAGAALFGASTVDALTARRFEQTERATQQIVRLATSLTPDSAPRLERLSGFGVGLLQPLTCACSCLAREDKTSALLICAVETVRPMLTLVERVRRLFGESNEALAAFTPAGDLVYATPGAQQRLQQANTLVAIEASALALDAMKHGESAGLTALGLISFWRVGRDANMLVVARFDPAPQSAASSVQADDIAVVPPSGQRGAERESIYLIQDDAARSGGASDLADNVSQAIARAKSAAAGPVRRHPLRFVWEMDADWHFKLISDEFIEIAGAPTSQRNGEPWAEICAALDLDPLQQVMKAVATRDTWSGIMLSWLTSMGEPIKVELSGLPIFDRQREFIGYRGFGVCRDLAQIDSLARHRRMDLAIPTVAPAPIPEPLTTPPEPNRPTLSLVPPSANVVPFPAALPAVEPRTPGLNAGERKAFSDIAQQLAARLKNAARSENAGRNDDQIPPITAPRSPPHEAGIDGRARPVSTAEDTGGEHADWLAEGSDARTLLDRLPFGVLVYRAQALLYANRAFLDRVGCGTLEEFAESGGLDNLLLASTAADNKDIQTLAIALADHEPVQADARLVSVPYRGEPALALVLFGPNRPGTGETAEPPRTSIREHGLDRVLEKILEQQIDDVRRRSDQIVAEHAVFLSGFGRDIRTPLTAIMGFAETMLGERFGPIGNERYRDYLSGIRNAGGRILALIDDLGRTPKAAESPDQKPVGSENAAVDLNHVVQSCVTELQPDASRDRVLIRTSLGRPLPNVAADGNAVRQIVLNLMTNSIKLAGAGGQVIISTGVNAAGTVSLRLRDTGVGVSEDDLAAALQAKPPAGEKTAGGSEGRLKLAVAKALAEANRASLKISSRPNDGTLVEVSFREVTSPAA
jgi:signal transduction histidine kinase